MSKIFMVMGKSASGKDTIFKKLKEIKSLGLKSVIPYTTRPIRDGERQGEAYFFVNEDKLHQLKEEKKVIEHRAYHTMHGIWCYFTVDDGQIDLNEHNYIVIGTLEAYEQIQNYFGKDTLVPIYIEVEDGLRLSRALKRERGQANPKYSELCRRFLADEEDFSDDKLKRLQVEKRYSNEKIRDCLNEVVREIRRHID